MNPSGDCQSGVRELYAWEIEEAKRVFADQLDYERIRVHECTPWPDRINNLGLLLKRIKPQGGPSHNAITIGYHCLFPVKLPIQFVPWPQGDLVNICWLIHELTHAWQYQHTGWSYLPKALYAQFRFKEKAYDYGGEAGLLESQVNHFRLGHFNPEQQGNITRDYYRLCCASPDKLTAYLPYIHEIQNIA